MNTTALDASPPLSDEDRVTEHHPFDIRNVAVVDDAGSEHYECQMTGRFLVDLHRKDLLRLTGNIRPAHSQAKLSGKTKTKVNKWTQELLENDAIIGNISVRLDPTKTDYEFWTDDDTGDECLTITEGYLDSAVDSLSRIKAILQAADNPLGTFDLSTRFQVRIWVAKDPLAAKIATIYNTRGDKVNDSTAKYAYAETKEQQLAQRLVSKSSHLGQGNVEVLSNSVSASSHKLTAFNTISRALEGSWRGGPVSEADVEAQSTWLIHAWDELIKVRPEYGMLSTPNRQEQRKKNIASSAVVLYGVIGAMSVMFVSHIDPAIAFKALERDDNGGDLFAWTNPRWIDAGVVTPTGASTRTSYTTRNSFPARRAAIRELCGVMGLTASDEDMEN